MTTTTNAANETVIKSWTKCTGKNGYNGALSDVQKIEYSTNYVYISSTSIPGTYTVGGGGWADDPLVKQTTKIILNFKFKQNSPYI